HHNAETSVIRMERESASMILKSTIEMLEKEISEFRVASQAVNVIEIAELCMVAGSTRDEALIEAKSEMDGLKGTMVKVENELKEMR
ncbi:hypothetical protein K458DRAFT_257791, partial [Lentithecium fluviatile CBS 122367]